jgi:hypothetical protein
MQLLCLADTNLNAMTELEMNILKRKKSLRDQLELASNVGVRY